MNHFSFIFLISNLITISSFSQKAEKPADELNTTQNFRTLTHNKMSREYFVHAPANYDETKKMPLMLHFHGGGGNIASAIQYSDMGSIADSKGFILVYPQALPEPDSAKDGGVWTYKDPLIARDVDNIGFVEAIIDALVSEYNIDKTRIYACGYSNGGEFVFELACKMSDQIAAIGVVARSMEIETFNTCEPTNPTAVMSIHGTKDDYEGITYNGKIYYPSIDQINQFWIAHNNLESIPKVVQMPDLNEYDASIVEHYSWNEGGGDVAVEHYKVIGGGHDWPGNWGNMDIDASLEIWNFVKRFSRSTRTQQLSIIRHSDGISISTDTQEGQAYRVQSSQDLRNWKDGEVIMGDGSTKSLKKSADKSKEFLRIVEE